MNTKLRSDSTLAQLTQEQRDDLFDWLASGMSFRDACKRAALPAPEGLSLTIHPTTLWRYYPRERARRHAEAMAERRSDPALDGKAELVAREAKTEFVHSIYELATRPENTQNFNALSRAFHRLEIVLQRDKNIQLEEQRLTLEKQRLDLDTRKFEYDAFLAAVEHAQELNKIVAEDKMTDLQKFELARPILFGPPLPASATLARNPDPKTPD